jgi:hypothetical protein
MARLRDETHTDNRCAMSRADLLSCGEWLSAEQVHDRFRTTSDSGAADWQRGGLIFGVDFSRERLFPSYQFDPESGEPLPIVAEVLSSFGEGADEWSIATWFQSPNAWIVNRHGTRLDPVAPKDALSRRSEVLEAVSKRSGTYVA